MKLLHRALEESHIWQIPCFPLTFSFFKPLNYIHTLYYVLINVGLF